MNRLVFPVVLIGLNNLLFNWWCYLPTRFFGATSADSVAFTNSLHRLKCYLKKNKSYFIDLLKVNIFWRPMGAKISNKKGFLVQIYDDFLTLFTLSVAETLRWLIFLSESKFQISKNIQNDFKSTRFIYKRLYGR